MSHRTTGEGDFYWHVQPTIDACVNCGESIPLPYARIPQTDSAEWHGPEDKNQLEWPPDAWSLTYACQACGCVAKYGTADVGCQSSLKQSEGRYRDRATCFCVQFPCGNTRCKAPATVYVDSPNGIEADALSFFRSTKPHGQLLCGHEIATVPTELYKIVRVLQRLW